jgi:hypothetical protein
MIVARQSGWEACDNQDGFSAVASPEIDRDRSSRPYPAQGKAESQAAT